MSKPVVPLGNKPLSSCSNLVLLSMFKLGQFNVLAAKVGISGFVLGRSAFLLPPEGFRCEREGTFVAASSLPQELRDPSWACGLCFSKNAIITKSKKHTSRCKMVQTHIHAQTIKIRFHKTAYCQQHAIPTGIFYSVLFLKCPWQTTKLIRPPTNVLQCTVQEALLQMNASQVLRCLFNGVLVKRQVLVRRPRGRPEMLTF